MGRPRGSRLLIGAGRLVAVLALAIVLAVFLADRPRPGGTDDPASTGSGAGSGPSGASAPPATARPTATPSWTAALATICLAMPSQAAGSEPPPMLAAAERALGRHGLQAMAAGACDATLTIEVVFTPLSKYYVGLMGPSGDCYTGARIGGEIRLEKAGVAPLRVPVDGSVEPSSGTISTCPGPTEAPFASLWPGLLLDGLSWLFGEDVLFEALGDAEADVRSSAIGRLASTGWPGVPEAVVGAMRDREPEVRSAAARALGRMRAGTPEAIAALTGALGDPEAIVQASAASALGAIGAASAPAVPALVRLMASSEDDWLRIEVMRALGGIGPAAREGLPDLIGLLRDPEVQVRVAAADALGAIGPAALEAVPGLIESLADEELWVRGQARRALEAITGEELGEAPGPWRQWWEARS